MFEKYGLADVPQFSDPEAKLYRAFGLQRARWWQLFGLRALWRNLGTILRGYLPRLPKGDPMQMPGVFLIHKGEIVRAFRHEIAGERPDYGALGTCEINK